MTQRQKRLARLVQLREQQHTRSVAALGIAHASLSSVELRIRAKSEEQLSYRSEQDEAMTAAHQEGWLLARSSAALCTQEMMFAMKQRAAGELEVTSAKQREAAARCAFSQMEELMLRVREEECCLQEAREQVQMEEAARFIKRSIEQGTALELP